MENQRCCSTKKFRKLSSILKKLLYHILMTILSPRLSVLIIAVLTYFGKYKLVMKSLFNNLTVTYNLKQTEHHQRCLGLNFGKFQDNYFV